MRQGQQITATHQIHPLCPITWMREVSRDERRTISRFHFLSSIPTVSSGGSLVAEEKENYTGLALCHGCWHEITPPRLPRNCLIPGSHRAAAPPATAPPPEWSAKQTGKLQAAVHIRPSLCCLFVGCCWCDTLWERNLRLNKRHSGDSI